MSGQALLAEVDAQSKVGNGLKAESVLGFGIRSCRTSISFNFLLKTHGKVKDKVGSQNKRAAAVGHKAELGGQAQAKGAV